MTRPQSRRLALTLAALVIMVGAWSQAGAQQYMGSEWCSTCHMEQYNQFRVSGHPFKLAPADEAMIRPIPLPEGYEWDDISYVIGGYKWKSRYMDTDGYIITSVTTEEGVVDGMNQYNNMTGGWVDYHPGEMKPYNCGSCHTTGFSPEGNQDELPGIHGTWAAPGVQCEACHGPGGEMSIDRSAAACGACHIRGDPLTIPAKGGFIRHHEQYNEQLASPHAGLDCVSCHDPHLRAEFSIHTSCEDCHGDYADSYAGSVMDVRGVTCVDCHLPYASKSAVAFSPTRGDVRTHLFSINTERGAEMFTPDGLFVALDADGQGAVTLDFACMDCHTDKSTQWVYGKAKNFHQRGSGPYKAENRGRKGQRGN